MFRRAVRHLASLRLWMRPGIHFKRWLLLIAVSSLFAAVGVGYLLNWLWSADVLPDVMQIVLLKSLRLRWRIILPLVVGGLGIGVALLGLAGTLTAPFRSHDEMVIESIDRHRRAGKGPRVVAIGGGTGLPGVLRGLTAYTRNITAIITVADDGGSSGRLRRELGMLPPGDFRNNIAALARDEALMAQVMQYRFGAVSINDKNNKNGEPSQLQGHAFGNLLIAALTGITGSFDRGLLAMDRVLAMNGRVMPSTIDDVTLVAEREHDGNVETIVGESAIPDGAGRIARVYLQNNGVGDVRAYPPAVKAILDAELIVLGPGSLYTSVLPNLVVPEIAQAIGYARARVVYVCNVATQKGETDGYTAGEHASAILDSAPNMRIDVVLANERVDFPADVGGGHTLFVETSGVEDGQLVTADLVDDARPWRHDSEKVARELVDLLRK